MLLKLLVAAIVLVVIFGFGFLWILFNEPAAVEQARSAVDRRPTTTGIKQCCLQDIRSAQEALTLLSIEAKKLRVKLNATQAAKDPAGQKLLSELAVLAEQPRAIWDQLDSLVSNPQENKRRQLRDVRIDMEGLKEHFQVIETCCGTQSALLPPIMKEYLQIALYRFGVVWDSVTKAEDASSIRGTEWTQGLKLSAMRR